MPWRYNLASVLARLPLALRQGGKEFRRPCELLTPLRRAMYPALSAEEELMSLPLQVLALAVYDCIQVRCRCIAHCFRNGARGLTVSRLASSLAFRRVALHWAVPCHAVAAYHTVPHTRGVASNRTAPRRTSRSIS